jgi:hypothetical protein
MSFLPWQPGQVGFVLGSPEADSPADPDLQLEQLARGLAENVPLCLIVQAIEIPDHRWHIHVG